jgi:hypothetical protein
MYFVAIEIFVLYLVDTTGPNTWSDGALDLGRIRVFAVVQALYSGDSAQK